METDYTAVEWNLMFRRSDEDTRGSSWLPDAPLSSEEVLYRILTVIGHPWDPMRIVDITHVKIRRELESALGINGGLLAPEEPWSSLKAPVTLEELILTLETAYLTCWHTAQEFGLQKEAVDHSWKWVAQCAAELGVSTIQRDMKISSVLSAEEAEILSFSLDWYAPDGQGRLARFQTPAAIFLLKLLVGLGGSVWCFLLVVHSMVPIWLGAGIWAVGGIGLCATDRILQQHEWSEPETTFGALADGIHSRARFAGETMRRAAAEWSLPKASTLTLLD